MKNCKITIKYNEKLNDCNIICKFDEDYLLKMDKNSLDDLIVFLQNLNNHIKNKEQG